MEIRVPENRTWMRRTGLSESSLGVSEPASGNEFFNAVSTLPVPSD